MENRNVVLNLVLSGVSGVADSVWTGTMLVSFLQELTNDSNTKVGMVAALQGASQLVRACAWVLQQLMN